ncbi:MAG: hypothetical protein FD166_1375 [Bacteroidetes bacterium]|nr:MAG: hypothetical protein FD166_1375 [Bacteroidota bacterium]
MKNSNLDYSLATIIDLLLFEFNRKYYRYSIFIVLVFLLVLFLYPVLCNIYLTGIENKLIIVKSLWGIFGVLAWFILIAFSKNKILIKIAVLDVLNYDSANKSIQVQLLRTFLVFLSFILYSIISILPSILIQTKRNGLNNSILYAIPEVSGIYLVLILLTLIICYSVFLLPSSISEKVKSHNNQAETVKYPYIYWFYFFLHKLTASPVLTYLLFPLFIVSSLTIILFPFAAEKTGQELHNNLFDVSNFSLLVTILGVWITTVIVIINDLLKDYFRIYKCFEEYTTFQLHNNINNNGNFRLVIIGFGNLSRIISGLVLPILFDKRKFDFHKPYRRVEVIIDKNLKLRVVPKSLLVIEKDRALFEEVRIDEMSGFTYGFLNGGDAISIEDDKISIPNSTALLGVCGIGSNMSLLHEIGIENAGLILNTSSDLDMGFKLKKIIDNLSTRTINYKPILISTVEDSTSYSFLESASNTPIYPVHTGRIEGSALGNRLFMFYNKSLIDKYQLKKTFIAGNGKSIYYIIETFRRNLKIFETQDLVDKILKDVFYIVTIDKSILQECYYDNSTEYKIWKIAFHDGQTVDLKVIDLDPVKFSSIIKVWNLANKMVREELNAKKMKGNFDSLFVVSTQNSYDTLRIAEHVKQISSQNINMDISILISVAYEIKDEIEKIIKDLPSINVQNVKNGFPFEIKDLIIKKNAIIGSQIVAMAGLTDRYNKNVQPKSEALSSEIIYCCESAPYSYLKALIQTSNLSMCESIPNSDIVPSLYYNYSFPILTPNKKYEDTFILRVDSFLINNQKFDNTQSIKSYYINSSDEVEKNIQKILERKVPIAACENCGHFNQRCPISYNHTIDKKRIGNVPETIAQGTDRLTTLATIKIWANNESVPGALAVCLADFLMIGDKIDLRNNLDEKLINIIYEYCSLCPVTNRTIVRLYTVLSDKDEATIQKIKHLLSERNIIAIKIKPANDIKEKESTNSWNQYSEGLLKYLNSFGAKENSMHHYEKVTQEPHNVIIIAKKGTLDDQDKMKYIDELL